jgi:hypothetical protein
VSQITVYLYLGFYELIERYPGILLSRFGVANIMKNRKTIINGAKTDRELNQLLMIGFPGMKIKNTIVHDSTFEIDNFDINMSDNENLYI